MRMPIAAGSLSCKGSTSFNLFAGPNPGDAGAGLTAALSVPTASIRTTRLTASARGLRTGITNWPIEDQSTLSEL